MCVNKVSIGFLHFIKLLILSNTGDLPEELPAKLYELDLSDNILGGDASSVLPSLHD